MSLGTYWISGSGWPDIWPFFAVQFCFATTTAAAAATTTTTNNGTHIIWTDADNGGIEAAVIFRLKTTHLIS